MVKKDQILEYVLRQKITALEESLSIASELLSQRLPECSVRGNVDNWSAWFDKWEKVVREFLKDSDKLLRGTHGR